MNIQDRIDALAASQKAATDGLSSLTGKVNQLINVANSAAAQIKQLIENGGLTDDQESQMQAIQDGLDTAVASEKTESDAVDTALAADSPAPPPAPAS